MTRPKHLSNKEKRETYINSFPVKKVAKKILLREFKVYIQRCKKMAKHPLRKNFPHAYIAFTRKISNDVWEVIRVKADYTKEHGLILHEPLLMYRYLTPTYTFYNNTNGFRWNIYPRYEIDVKESRKINTWEFDKYPVIPTRFLKSYGYVPNSVIEKSSMSLINAPLFETTYKTKSKVFFELFAEQYSKSSKTYLQVFPFLRSKQELKEFEAFILTTPINMNTYRDFVRMARKNNDPIFVDNWREKHDEYVRIENAEQEAKKKGIEKKLTEMKKNVFKTNPKDIKYRFFQPKTKKDLKEIGKDMSICVGSGYDPKEIILATLNDYMVCIQYKEKRFIQIYTYKNTSLPEKIETQLRKGVRKWHNSHI